MAKKAKDEIAKKAKDEINFKEAALAYFKSVKLEWGKITWPAKNDVFRETIFVVIITAFFTIAVLAMDTIFAALFKALGLVH